MKKKLLGFIVINIIGLAAHAQSRTANRESSLSIKGGLNIANISNNNGGYISEANSLNSYHLGLNYDLPLSKFGSVQFGFMVTGKGSKTEVGKPGDAIYSKATTKPYYIEIPVNLVANFPLTAGFKAFAGAGPYGAIGIAGMNTIKTISNIGAIYKNKDIDFNNKNPNLNPEGNAGYAQIERFDYGLNILGGIEWKSFIMGVNFGYGLAQVVPASATNSNSNLKNRVLSVSLSLKL